MSVRVAIIGLGPKGLFALERVLHHARAAGTTVRVDVFEPHPAPGAGPVYDPSQPAYLRMNFPSSRIDLWPQGSLAVPVDEQRSFSTWGHRRPQQYAARAEVGRYLADGLRRMCAAAPPGTVRVLPRRVDALARDDGRWVVDGGTERYDEVVLATGHRSPDRRRAWPHAAPLIAAVFPVEGLGAIRPGAVVAVRGFALTALDACLALTEGRGGQFATTADGRCVYARSGAEPARILPFSRTGRPMHAKPDPDLFAGDAGLDRLAREGSDRLLGLPEDLEVERDLVDVLVTAATGALRATGGAGDPGLLLRELLAAPGPDGAATTDARAELARSLLVGTGRAAPDAAWALGHTWRTLYPAIVARCGGTGLDDAQWPAFRRLAGELERISFGPPAGSVRKLLALVDAGVVDLSGVAAGTLREDRGRTVLDGARGHHRVDVVIDAVLPGPGVRVGDGGVAGSLVAAGHARLHPGRRGIEVGPDATVVGPDGPVPGLAAVGRPTEDWVIGNDTLSRTLHPQVDRWARRVATAAGDRRPVAA